MLIIENSIKICKFANGICNISLAGVAIKLLKNKRHIMLEKINAIKEEINAAVATNLQEVEELRIKYLSKKGLVTSLFSEE